MELIGVDEDGFMSLWQGGNVLPMTIFEQGRPVRGHHVIQWKGHAITTHLSGFWGRDIEVQFMCGRDWIIRLPFAEVEAMLLGKVIPDPEHEARVEEGFRRLTAAVHARNREPHHQRGRIQ